MRKRLVACLLAMSFLGGARAAAGPVPNGQPARERGSQKTSEAAEPQRGCRRWAILASEAVEDGGLPDLLTAKLSERDDLEWVERQQLQAIIAEQRLSACFGAQAVGERIELGKLVGADVLVLLSLEEREKVPLEADQRDPAEEGEKETFLKLMISDCRYGARLWLEYLPYATDRFEPLCQACAAAVDHTRRRFAQGVRQVIAVTPFLSKNLVYDYDHLQAGYAYLLQIGLISYPGVAVVETEEARAIRRELDIAGAGLAERVVPLFVEGEYEMTVDAPEVEPAVRLSLRVSDAERVRLELQRKGLPLSEVAELLRGPVPQQIVELSQQSVETALTREQQCALLAKRADLFSQFGAFELSTGLREAALLLEPDDVDQRLASIGDYLRWQLARVTEWHALDSRWRRQAEQSPDHRQHRQAWELFHREHFERSRLMVGHVERLLVDRALNAQEAARLAQTVLFYARMGPQDYPDAALAAESRSVLRDFVWRLYPLFPRLDPGIRGGAFGAAVRDCIGWNQAHREMSPLFQYYEWTTSAVCFLSYLLPTSFHVREVGYPQWDGPQVLDDLFRFLTQVASSEIPVLHMKQVTTDDRYGFLAAIDKGWVEAEDVRRFYTRLIQTGRPMNVLYGRLGLLAMRVYREGKRSVGREDLREIEELLATLRQYHPDDRAARNQVVSQYEQCLERLREEIVKIVGDVPQEKRHPLPANPISPTDARLEVTFEPIEGKPFWSWGLRKCTNSMDVTWTERDVSVIGEGGTIRTIFRTKEEEPTTTDKVYSVAWDGESFWIACATSAIHVVSPAGEVLEPIGPDQGLLPYAARGFTQRDGRSSGMPPLVLHAVAPRQCLAIGSLGRGDRLWFALISRRGEADRQVRVFHTAAKASATPPGELADDAGTAFQVGSLTEYAPPQAGSPRLLLVGRRGLGACRRPLAIDLRSLAVSVFPAELPVFDRPVGFGPHGLAVSNLIGIALFSPPGKGYGDWTRTELVRLEVPYGWTTGTWPLIPYAGMLYRPGIEWARLDPQTGSVERLADLAVPGQEPFKFYGVSAHHGLVAWNLGDKLYRISIEPRPPSDADLSVLYPYMPPSSRARHHQAAEAIRSLGGSVDTRLGFCRHGSTLRNTLERRTIVYLPKAWRGGNRELTHLDKLYNLRDLYLVQADVTDEGLRVIGKLDGLESLYLVETKATDEGLIHLQGLDELIYLRLEGTAGAGQFGDGGLKHVRDLSRLRKLTLYGKGFTDQGLVHLQSLPQLRELWMLNTAITNTALNLLKGRKRGLTCRALDYRAGFARMLIPID